MRLASRLPEESGFGGNPDEWWVVHRAGAASPPFSRKAFLPRHASLQGVERGYCDWYERNVKFLHTLLAVGRYLLLRQLVAALAIHRLQTLYLLSAHA